LGSPIALRLCEVEILKGRVLRLKGLILPRFHEEVGRTVFNLEPKVVLTRQFEEGQKRSNDEPTRFVPDKLPKGHPRFSSKAAHDVSLLLFDGVLDGLYLVDRLVVLVLHFENAPEGFDELVDGGVDLHLVILLHPFTVFIGISPNEVIATTLAAGR
jgi:hypothetical protein